MFNPEGGELTKPGNRGEGGINFKAVFTGIVDVQPLCFNPTKQDICRIKQIPDDRQASILEPQYNNLQDQEGRTYSRLTLLAKFNPNELLAEKDDDGNVKKRLYADDVYVEISWRIMKDDELSKGDPETGKTQKYRFINESLQSTWAENLDKVKGNEKMSWFKTETARIAKRGEVLLYNLLSALYKFAGTKENPITGFKLGTNPTEVFEDIVNGDVTMLNDMLDPDAPSYQYFSHEDGSPRKIAIMLGATISDKEDDHGNPYINQRVYVNQYVNNCFAKEGRWLPKDAIDSIQGDGFKAMTGGSLTFKEFVPGSIEDTNDAFSDVDDSAIDQATEDFSDESLTEAFDMGVSDEDFA